ncbi:hypothetical protein [Roseateles violae]|uniref:DUF1579 domain-containing protein n=1 Tax=Roseateles violae TaxID=3058042 RepID=A0ABT8DVD2_9BURK|nr:hypothetical protein [Pelomonas sp. PFR6]MDN3922103.1 hypothetical protein [Pelomonas sp. PFR6]
MGTAADFDFLVGAWRIRNRKLLKPLQGADDWEQFGASMRMSKLPGGIGNVDDFTPEGDWRPGFVGMSLRVFNPLTGLWSIFWLNNRDGGLEAATGHLLPPVVGGFDGDRGIFEGDDRYDGRTIRVRYQWDRLGTEQLRWQQAFSSDGGCSWETNWVMEMSRA